MKMTYKELIQNLIALPTDCLDKEVSILCVSNDQAIEPFSLSIVKLNEGAGIAPFIIVSKDDEQQ